MKGFFRQSGKVLTGMLVIAGCALPQRYTLSAKPGAVNYVEGVAHLNGNLLSTKATRATFLAANDTLSTASGKAEVLLSPGVFLRIGDNSQIRMIAPSLVNTQVEVTRGEAMIEVSGLVKDDTVQVTDHGGSITLERDGLYRINADDPPRVDVLEGKATVSYGSREANLNKGHEIVLSNLLKSERFDAKKADDLYAWSNVRSEYDSAASYQTASTVSNNSFGGWGGYGFSGFSSPGWYWANGFNSWAWLPGAGSFYSPFGYGFYAPGAVAYAPVVWSPVASGFLPGGTRLNTSVPVNPRSPAAVGRITASPAANNVARAQVAQSFAATGFQTASGHSVTSFSGARSAGFSGNSAGAGRGGFSGGTGAASMGAGHAGGGGGAHR